MKFFDYKSPLMRFLKLLMDMITLSTMWFFYSIPIITIGASTTALYYAALHRMKDDSGYIAKNFRHAFHRNFKQATGMWLLFLLAGFIVTFDLSVGAQLQNGVGDAILLISAVMLVVYLVVMIYAFALQAAFENSIKTTLMNAFLLGITNFPKTFSILVLLMVCGLAFYLIPTMIVLIPLLIAGAYACVTSCVFLRVFAKYGYGSPYAKAPVGEQRGEKGLDIL